MHLYQPFIKRLLDVLIALIAIMVLSPLIVIVFIFLFIGNKSLPIFFQVRPGKNARPIKIVKFKTMTDDRDAEGKLLPDKNRITKTGAFCRKYSLDELPQLINVLIGDMSLVGPRPLLFKYVPLYSKEQFRRHEVRPGITGWAQVNGRNSISWGEKFELDVYYVDHLTFWLDIKILTLTLIKVIKREGVNQSEERPMMPFTGNN